MTNNAARREVNLTLMSKNAANEAGKTAPASTPTVHDKFLSARRDLAAGMIERDEEIDLALVAVVAQENLFLLGPPGVGKSMLIDGLLSWLDGPGFSYLLNEFTTPEELFGPFRLSELKNDKYIRNTENRLPRAVLGFLDEVFKANSAILNTLLRVMNEKVFENDGAWARVPLRMLMAASNEVPTGENAGRLGAMFDRFLFRRTVRPVSKRNRARLLYGDHRIVMTTRVTPEELDQAHADAKALEFTDEAGDALSKILDGLAADGVVVSDRRQVKAVRAAKAAAWLDGASEVRPEHLEVLQYVLWTEPDHADRAARIVCSVANPSGMEVNRLTGEVNEIMGQVDMANTGSLVEAAEKLKEIRTKLEAYNTTERGARAFAFVTDELKRVRMATAGTMTI